METELESKILLWRCDKIIRAVYMSTNWQTFFDMDLITLAARQCQTRKERELEGGQDDDGDDKYTY